MFHDGLKSNTFIPPRAPRHPAAAMLLLAAKNGRIIQLKLLQNHTESLQGLPDTPLNPNSRSMKNFFQ
jgi:hypothetical protein